ncbi:hypothetical protein CEE35_08830 [Candidatus Aerophobetes bacterium Ae_b3b]|nr:MAG: hypothetical protein CEE35_08830 [Candidatus Aerophobetes bacterium Ae_b3b]
MEYCIQKGITISEALAEIIKFIDRLVIDMEIEEMPSIMTDDESVDAQADLGDNPCYSVCPIFLAWYRRYKKEK